MGIVFGMMVPHPPIIMSEIGHGEERKIQATIDAYRTAAKEAAKQQPEVLVISSPHSLLYADYFHISPGETAYGDMSRFSAPQVSFSVSYDTQLVSVIEDLARQSGFPAGTLGNRMPELDHGTMVPLYFLQREMPDAKMVRIGLSGLSYGEHYLMGKLIKLAAEQTGRRVCYVASGDLAHKQKEDGPYGLVPEGPAYDERLMDVMGRGAFGELFDFDEDFCDKAGECGHRSFLMMAGAFDGCGVRTTMLSHQATFGVGYGICYYEPTGADDTRYFLNERTNQRSEEMEQQRERESAWVRLARKTVEMYVTGRQVPDGEYLMGLTEDVEEKKELFHTDKGAFVSIHKEGKLRGCIGTFLPTTDCVADEIIQNAVSAATKDPRFLPIRADELQLLEITVDVLETPEPISDASQLDVKEYGVIVTSGMKRGLLLPDLEGVDTVEEQIAIARQKAGIDEDAPISLERFRVVRHY